MPLFETKGEGVGFSPSANLDGMPDRTEWFRNMDPFCFCSDMLPINGFTYNKNEYAFIDGYLFTIFGGRKKTLLGVPFDPVTGKLIDFGMLFDIMGRYGFKKVEQVVSDLVPADAGAYFQIKQQKEIGKEYIFDNYALTAMEGKEFKNLRKAVNKFVNHYGDTIEVISYEDSMFEMALEGYDAWARTAGAKIVKNGGEVWDRSFFEVTMKNASKLGMDAFLVRDKQAKKIIGCSAHVIVSDDLAYGVFRKMDTTYRNLVQYIQIYQAKILADYQIHYFNDAYDGSNPGLADLKSCFKPVKTFSFVTLTPCKQKSQVGGQFMSQKSQKLELIELGDIDSYEVYDEIVDFIQTTGYPFNVNEWSNDYLYEIEESDAMEFYLLRDGSKQIMGFICVELYEDYIWIVDILVGKKLRGRGYAKRMIRDVMEICGVDQVVLNVNPLNTNAIIAYLKMGFVITGYVSFFYSDGSPCVYMKWRLKADGD